MRIAAIVCALLVAAPTVAEACPFCARQNESGRTVYYVATALMLLLPVLLVGGLVWWIRARSRRSDSSGEQS